MKKLAAVLLTVMLALMLWSCGAKTQQTYQVEISCPIPYAGADPMLFTTQARINGQTVDNGCSSWYDADRQMTYGETFDAGKEYRIDAYFRLPDGAAVADMKLALDTQIGRLGTAEPYRHNGESYCLVSVYVPVEKLQVVIDFPMPTVGGTAAQCENVSVTVSGEAVTDVVDGGWTEINSTLGVLRMNSGSTFDYDTKYRRELRFRLPMTVYDLDAVDFRLAEGLGQLSQPVFDSSLEYILFTITYDSEHDPNAPQDPYAVDAVELDLIPQEEEAVPYTVRVRSDNVDVDIIRWSTDPVSGTQLDMTNWRTPCGGYYITMQVVPQAGYHMGTNPSFTVTDFRIEDRYTTPTTAQRDGEQVGAYQISVRVDTLPHVWIIMEQTQPTCVRIGLIERECFACGEVRRETHPALGHSMGAPKRTEPTCTTVGEELYTCSICGETERKEIPVLPHNFVQNKCTVCGGVACGSAGHIYGEWVTTKQPTCTEAGSRKNTCTACGNVVNETLPATNQHIAGAWTVTKAATCNSEGTRIKSCTMCKKEMENEVIPKESHNYAWKVERAATCGEAGSQVGTCSKCGDIKNEEIPATENHTYGPWKDVGNKHKCTCTVCNYAKTLDHHFADGKCTECGAKQPCTHAYSAWAFVDKDYHTRECTKCHEKETKIHTYGEWKIVTPATCTTPGSRKNTCSGCGNVVTEAVPITDHTVASWDETPPTCVQNGSRTGTCTLCDKPITEILEATGKHIYDGGKCTMCDAPEPGYSGDGPEDDNPHDHAPVCAALTGNSLGRSGFSSRNAEKRGCKVRRGVL